MTMTNEHGSPVMTEFQKAKFAGSRAIGLQQPSYYWRGDLARVVSENLRELI
jgi:hypothetical protein